MLVGSRKHNPIPATVNLTHALKETLAMKTKPATATNAFPTRVDAIKRVAAKLRPALDVDDDMPAPGQKRVVDETPKVVRVAKQKVVIDDAAGEVRAPKKVVKAITAALDAAEGKASDDNMLSVSDVAREMGIDPKVARAKLRRMGQAATEGRWAKVKRDSREHKALVAALTPPVKTEAE